MAEKYIQVSELQGGYHPTNYLLFIDNVLCQLWKSDYENEDAQWVAIEGQLK